MRDMYNSPPRQNSSNHILNALSDECIQRVLNYLIRDIRDFLSAAEVCRKFQDNAKKCFSSKHTNFHMGCRIYDELPLHRVKNFLNIFGHLMQSIRWERNDENTYQSEIFNAIANFCGKNVLRLHVKDHHLDFTMASKFEVLDELILHGGSINNFKLPPNLKKLHLDAFLKFDNMDWMLKTYPNLNRITFESFNQLNDSMIIEFQALNPQLQFFSISCKNVTSSILQGIATRVPNLVELKFRFSFRGDKMDLQRKFEEDVMHLSGLRHLKRLRGINPHQMSTCSIIDVLADNDIPIKDLAIDGQNPHIVTSLIRLKNIKKLVVYDFNFDMVFDLVIKSLTLENLYIKNCAQFTTNHIIQILEQITNLKSLEIRDRDMVLNMDILADFGRVHANKMESIIKYDKECHPYSQWFKITMK